MSAEKERDLDLRRQSYLEKISRFRLIDDSFMCKVFEDKACLELLLRIILERDDLSVVKSYEQHEIKNLQGRSVRLDIVACDKDGLYYNIEIQRSDRGAAVKRARYHSSLLDANITDPGEDYSKLPETYVIFITEHDVIGDNEPIYIVERVIQKSGKLFGDGEHIIYVNSQIQNETLLGKLMHDFYCTKADEMNYKVLADRVRYFKEDKKGVSDMDRIMEELKEETIREERIKIASNLLSMGVLSVEDIAKCSELPVEKVKELAENLKK